MTISRRKFMKAGMMVAACAGIPLKSYLANSQEVAVKRSKTPALKALPQKTDMLGYYNQSTFAPYVNTEFRVRLNASKVRSIKLVEVKDYMNASSQGAMSGSGEERFSLFFTSPADKSFPQNTYEVEHPALGKFLLFLVPVGMHTEGGRQYFEAAFNRRDQYSIEYKLPVLAIPSSGNTHVPSSGNTQKSPIIVTEQEPPIIITTTPPLKPKARRKLLDY